MKKILFLALLLSITACAEHRDRQAKWKARDWKETALSTRYFVDCIEGKEFAFIKGGNIALGPFRECDG